MLSIMQNVFNTPCGDVLSQSLIDLRPEEKMGFDSISPLVCIGQWLYISDDDITISVENIFISKSAHVIFILSDAPEASIRDKIISDFSTITLDTLNCIASEYFFRTCGQSYLVRDIMVKHGHWDFETASVMEQKIQKCLSEKNFSLFCAEK